jgi:hypothetical protein
MKWTGIILLISSMVFSLYACKEKPENQSPQPCSLKVDSNSILETYQIDTQTINYQTKNPITKIGSIPIDSNNAIYRSYTFNHDGSLITKHSGGRISPARSFKIENGMFHYGNDILPIKSCSDKFLILVEEDLIDPKTAFIYYVHLRLKTK